MLSSTTWPVLEESDVPFFRGNTVTIEVAGSSETLVTLVTLFHTMASHPRTQKSTLSTM
jgi:hypothetical protein